VGASIYTAEYRELLVLVRRLRQEAGLSQDRLAERLGHRQSWISKVESGERRLDLEELRQLCEVLDVDLMEVVGRWLKAIHLKPKALGAKRRR